MVLSKVVLISIILFNTFQTGFSVEILNNDNHLINTKDTTLYVGGSGLGNYSKIQDAVDNASSGDVIFVYSGTYHEGIIINKTVALLGEDKNSTIIDSTNISDVSINITKNADEVTISGFTIESDENYWGAISVYLVSDNNTISNNILRDYEGIVIQGYGGEVSNGNNILNNDIFTWHVGITTKSSMNNIIHSNYISSYILNNKGTAINSEYSDDNMILNNRLLNNEYGLILYGSSNNVVSGNIIQDSIWCGIMGGSNTGNILCHNVISGNEDGGIQLHFVTSYKIFRNKIENNDVVGIGVYYSRMNKVYENNFLNNEKDASWQNTPIEFLFLWRNRWYNNYWGESRTLPKPIFGFVYLGAIVNLPLLIPRFQYDLFPAQEPYDI